MRAGIRKAASLGALLALMTIGLAACGSGDETTTTNTTVRPAVSRETGDHLAKLSDRIASDLDSGDLCHAAHAADDLSSAVEDSDLPASLRPGVETVATDLVNQVNCPAPPPPPEPQKPKKDHSDDHGNGENHGNGEKHGNGNGEKHGNGNGHGNGHSKHGGFVPPGNAKLKGEG
jgi:hypothetical protein